MLVRRSYIFMGDAMSRNVRDPAQQPANFHSRVFVEILLAQTCNNYSGDLELKL